MFRQDTTCPALLVFISGRFHVRAITLCRQPFQTVPLTHSKKLKGQFPLLAATKEISG